METTHRHYVERMTLVEILADLYGISVRAVESVNLVSVSLLMCIASVDSITILDTTIINGGCAEGIK